MRCFTVNAVQYIVTIRWPAELLIQQALSDITRRSPTHGAPAAQIIDLSEGTSHSRYLGIQNISTAPNTSTCKSVMEAEIFADLHAYRGA